MRSTPFEAPATDQRDLFGVLLGDGRPAVLLAGLALALCGGFALFLAATGQFLPQDVHFLGLAADRLCLLQQCRIVHFMIHDRAAFGGSLIATGSLYMWIAEFPLRMRDGWAWWTVLITSLAGFASFLAYLGYGYLDSWHGAATLLLLPVIVVGLLRSRATLRPAGGLASVFRPSDWGPVRSRLGFGRVCLLLTAAGMIGAGLTILTVGMTSVFVPTDLAFIGLDARQISAINPHLVPLIAHDRAGFGGGIASAGLLVFLCLWCGRPSRNLWQVLAVAGTCGFCTAIGVHPIIGYTNLGHLAPALAGAGLFVLGLGLTAKPMLSGGEPTDNVLGRSFC